MQLDIHVTFTAGHFHGAEWPPSPARLFQALVAATHRGAHGLLHSDIRNRALEWLESCPPPTIFAIATEPARELITGYVPNNDDGESKDFREHVKTAKSLRLHPLPPECRVSYQWEFAAEGDSAHHADVVSAMASLVTYLGRTVDLVYARGEVHAEPQVDALGERRLWQPHEVPGGEWLVPSTGFLDWCQRRFPRSVSDLPPDFTNSRQVKYSDAPTSSDKVPSAIFELFRTDGSLMRFDPRRLREAAGMVRHVFSDWLGANPRMRQHYGEDRITRLLLGHQSAGVSGPSQGGHFGIVPLPSMNADFTADGDMRRVLVLGWGINDDEDRALFGDLTRGIDGMKLLDRGRSVGFLRVARPDTQRTMLAFWSTLAGQPAKTWRTVSPIVLTGHPRRGRALEMCLARALTQQGISPDTIESVATFSGPLVPQCPAAREFRVADYLSTTRRIHAEIIFRKPITGPLVVGRGRFAGFGIMLPSA
ncbi:MAG: type I-U CRISPR-associated protein Csb2 [Verrucomicrobiia bacterium]